MTKSSVRIIISQLLIQMDRFVTISAEMLLLYKTCDQHHFYYYYYYYSPVSAAFR